MIGSQLAAMGPLCELEKGNHSGLCSPEGDSVG